MNKEIYNKVANVPQNAQKQIGAGRLKGMTDINPMWRIDMLTELFGAAGVGWYTEITKQWLEPGADGVICAFCNINLYIKVDGEWSKPIFGTGGSSFVAKEKGGLYTSDEVFKMCYTDALSVACKALGFGANVYWQQGRTKYNDQQQTGDKDIQEIMRLIGDTNTDLQKVLEAYKVKSLQDMTAAQIANLKKTLRGRLK